MRKGGLLLGACVVMLGACGRGDPVGTASDPSAPDLAAAGPWATWAPANPEPAGKLAFFRVPGLGGFSYDEAAKGDRTLRRLLFVPESADSAGTLDAFSHLEAERAGHARCARPYVPPETHTNEEGVLEMPLVTDFGEREIEHRGRSIVVVESFSDGDPEVVAARRWDAPWCLGASAGIGGDPDPRDLVTSVEVDDLLATELGRHEPPPGWQLLFDLSARGSRVEDRAEANYFDDPDDFETFGFLTILHGQVTPLTFMEGGDDDTFRRQPGRGGADLLVQEIWREDLFCSADPTGTIRFDPDPDLALSGIRVTWLERPDLLVSLAVNDSGCPGEEDLRRDALDLVEGLEQVSEQEWRSLYPRPDDAPGTAKAPS